MLGTASIGGPLTLNASGAAAGPVSVNITAPQENTYLHSSYAELAWEVEDPDGMVSYYNVYLDSLSDPLMTTGTEVNLTHLADGPHYVLVRAFNDSEGGLLEAEDSVFFFIDTAPPALSIVSPTPNAYLNRSDVTITWQASDSVNIAYFEVQMDSLPAVSPNGPDPSSHTFAGLADGQHTATVIAHGWGGRTTSAAVTFYTNTTYPSLVITSPDDNDGFGRSEVTVEWAGADRGGDIQGYEIYVDGIYSTTAGAGTESITLLYPDGYHTVRIVAVDIAGSTASDEVTFLVDTHDTVVTIVRPLDGATSVPVDSTVQVNFDEEMDHAATSVSVSGGVTGTVSWSGLDLIFTPSAALAYGTSYTVTVSSQDKVGTPITKTWTFTTTDEGRVSGVVIDNNGKPLSGVTVTMDGQTTVVTNETGEFTFYPRSGNHTLTMSKTGWDGKTVAVDVRPGEAVALGSVSISPSNPLAIYGIIAAVVGVAIVVLLIYMGRYKKKDQGPPSRSWRGMEELQKRAEKDGRSSKPSRMSRKGLDEEDEDDYDTL